MKIVYQKFITRDEIKANPNKLFIFGDNLERTGFGGQAKEMRGEPNSFGIATKLKATHNPEDLMRDSVENLRTVMIDFEKLHSHLFFGSYTHIVIPEDGIGTGLAKLSDNAPMILAYINCMLFTYIPRWNV